MPDSPSLHPSGAFASDAVRFLCATSQVQAEVFAAATRAYWDVTKSVARSGLQYVQLMTLLACSIDHGDAVDVLSDFVEGELERYPAEAARLCDTGSRLLSRTAEIYRDVADDQANWAAAKTIV
jgi:hypothetical protein